MPEQAIHPAPEKLTVKEIEARYPDQWVVLVNVDTVDMKMIAGVVYAHHPNRSVLHPIIMTLRNFAVFWTGPVGNVSLWALSRVARNLDGKRGLLSVEP